MFGQRQVIYLKSKIPRQTTETKVGKPASTQKFLEMANNWNPGFDFGTSHFTFLSLRLLTWETGIIIPTMRG